MTGRASARGYRALDVPGFSAAVLYVPESAKPRPLVVASHGAGGMPEAECEYWRTLTHSHAFILCLRGSRVNRFVPSGYYYPHHFALDRELRAALRSLRSRYGALLANTGAVYAGFSQGAIMGAVMIPEHGRDFPRLALIEGGFQYWNLRRARTFARNGGKRVLFVCGTRWCADGSQEPAAWLRKSGVEVRIEYAPGTGHTPGGRVMARAAGALPWLVNDEPSWRSSSADP